MVKKIALIIERALQDTPSGPSRFLGPFPSLSHSNLCRAQAKVEQDTANDAAVIR